MSYQVLYRAWRPQGFEELVGQEAIKQTLENAIVQNRLSHAYLFAGPRGTGKTSTARILAKAINCPDRREAQPCGVCESCRSIQAGHAMDVIELDAASNRGIEEIRNLKENISFLPALGAYKVFIIDEVHMLTTEAFNALLKTLEEPPDHAIFVLATTDVQKLPATILSRCQRFDFQRIPDEVIRQRLETIVESLEIEVEPEVYALIAKKADGGLRDAISLLDQCLAYAPQRLEADQVYRILGQVHQERLAQILDALADQRAQSLFLQMDTLFQEGIEPFQFLRDFVEYLRNLLMMQLCGQETSLVQALSTLKETMHVQGERLGRERLQQMMAQVDQLLMQNKLKGNPRFMVEALMVRLMLPEAQDKTQMAVLPERVAPQRTSASEQPTTRPFAPKKKTVPEKAAEVKIEKETTAGKSFGPGSWEQILQKIKGEKITLHAFLSASVEQTMEGQTLRLAFDPEKGKFHKERTEEPGNRQMIAQMAETVLGFTPAIEVIFKSPEEEKDPIKKALAIFGQDIVEIKP